MSWRPSVIVAAIAAIAITACGGSQKQDSQVVRSQPQQVGYEPSTFDRCPVLRGCFGDATEYENCPDPVATFGSASADITSRSEKVLAEVVAELKQVDSIAKLQLIGYALKTEPPYVADARAKAVKKWLIDHGVSESLLETDTVTSKGSQGYVSFAPSSCSGTRTSEDDATAAAIFLVL